jgi:hypothetical protein
MQVQCKRQPSPFLKPSGILLKSSTVESILAVLFGVISSLTVVIFVEWQRQPRLTLAIPDPSDQDYTGQNRPAQIMRCLRIRVRNRELPWLLRWMRRESAENCLGTVQFLHLDGTRYFTGSMPARWTGSPEATPLLGLLTSGGVILGDIALWDPARLSIVSKMDIPAGEQEDLDIVVRCDNDLDCYGFNNDSYRARWKNEQWMLPKGRYRVEVTVRSAGQKLSKRFLLDNESRRDQFRLEDDPEPARHGS